MKSWNELSMAEKADIMKLAIDGGVYDLDAIRSGYNEYAKGGKKSQSTWTMEDEAKYREWRSSLPANLRNTDDNLYDMRGAYKAEMKPTLELDGRYHLQSRDPKTGRILKSPLHPTYLQALATDASMGYYPVVDNQGNTYTQTWEGNQFKSGGSIHIKPSKRGTFTAAASKHGKSVQAFASQVLAHPENYSPAMRKKANFARNAAKWKHGDGGNLYGGDNKNGQQMQLGLKVTNDWNPYSLDDMLQFATINEANKAAQEAAIARIENDYLTASNDATAIANGRLQNQHLAERAIEGAKQHRAWEEEHPAATFVGNVLGAAPLAIAAIPTVGAAVESAPAAASALAPGSAFWMNPITQQIAASTLGGTAIDATTHAVTGKSWGEEISGLVNETTGWNPQDTWYGSMLADMTNPGYLTPYGAVYSGTGKAIEAVSPVNRAVKNTVDNIERRGAETFMRTTPYANPLPEAENGIASMWNGQNGGRQRLAHIANYILTGKKVGPKGYYNSFAGYIPLDNSTLTTNPTLTQRWKDFMNPRGESFGYTGFVDVNGKVPRMTDRKDMIDAFLYGEEIDPSFGMRRIAIGEDFGPHKDYVSSKYPSKAHDIQVYEMNTPEGFSEATPVGDWKGVDKGLFKGGTEDYLNVAGHIGTKGVTSDGTSVIQRQDIWKFNPDEYFNRWLQNTRPYTEMSPKKQKLIKWGLKEVDRLGTPVISRTKWDRWGWL